MKNKMQNLKKLFRSIISHDNSHRFFAFFVTTKKNLNFFSKKTLRNHTRTVPR